MARRSGYYVAGGASSAPAGPPREYKPAIDKNPFYRTNDIFKRAYRKEIRIEEGGRNSTDCTSTIWVRFSDPLDQEVAAILGNVGSRTKALLQCGHEWEGKKDINVGDVLPCGKCGQEQSYLSFEHEWEHVIFKSDPAAARVFIEGWAHEVRQTAPHVDETKLKTFLFDMLNAFDDIRVNSLWEKLYAGSADRIWQRWTRISNERGPELNSDNFIAYLFAVALGTPTTPDGPYESLRPVIEWGMYHVRYKGYIKAMKIARLALDRCLALLFQPQPPHEQEPQPQGGSNGAQASNDQQQQSQDSGSSAGGAIPDAGGNVSPGDVPPSDGGAEADGSDQPQDAANRVGKSRALQSLLKNAQPVDDKEVHHVATTPPSDATRAAVIQLLQNEPDSPIDVSNGEIDADMQDALEAFRDNVVKMSPDSQLMADAKAKILFIDVRPEGTSPTSVVTFNAQEEEKIARMRGIFFRTLGRMKAQRDSSGSSIDIDAAIQYDIEPNDPDVFEHEQNNQGFAYLTLADMSGSMTPRFGRVTKGSEMLKRALKFPFVEGDLWGFRGGDPIKGRGEVNGEVWMYRWDRKCQGYIGRGKAPGKPFLFPVECGGLTPMHSAVRVAVKHLLTNVSSGMAKWLFLLTDGAPCSTKVNGKGLPHWVLQQYVAKEIQWARQRGIHVYTLVIDGGLEEKECRQMFGPPQFWRYVSSHDDQNSIDRVLENLVIQNFERYLKSRG